MKFTASVANIQRNNITQIFFFPFFYSFLHARGFLGGFFGVDIVKSVWLVVNDVWKGTIPAHGTNKQPLQADEGLVLGCLQCPLCSASPGSWRRERKVWGVYPVKKKREKLRNRLSKLFVICFLLTIPLKNPLPSMRRAGGV